MSEQNFSTESFNIMLELHHSIKTAEQLTKFVADLSVRPRSYLINTKLS